MTDKEINIAIAKACGKKACDHHPEVWERRGPEGDSELYCIRCEAYLHDMRLCDYLNDLNAIHQACMAHLTGRQGMEFFWVLLRVMNQPENLAMSNAAQIAIHATARQRSEAFLRTIGKWHDG